MKKLLILIVILVAGYFTLNRFYPQVLQKIPVVKQEIKKETEQKQAPKQAPDETAGWKTYRNKEYGFEVSYPNDWGVAFEDYKTVLRTKKFESQRAEDFYIELRPEDYGTMVNVYDAKIFFGSFGDEIKDLSELKKQIDCKVGISKTDTIPYTTEWVDDSSLLYINNLQWLLCKRLTEGFTSYRYYTLNKDTQKTIYFIANSNERIINADQLKVITEKILSTFKFIK